MTADDPEARLFMADAAYAHSMVRSALGELEASIEGLEQAIACVPTYAPAILTLASIDYQLGDVEQGRQRLLSLLDLPDDESLTGTSNLADVLDQAGDFLISRSEYGDGFELYQRASARYPEVAVLHQGLCVCAGREGDHDTALAAAEAALALEPDNQRLVNDLGWTLFERGEYERSLAQLERAVALDPEDELAAENLRLCIEKLEGIS